MTTSNWRARAGATFVCEKRPAHGARGMVVANHPLASAAGAEMLAAGGVFLGHIYRPFGWVRNSSMTWGGALT